jgi:hypothetical protein
MMKNNNHLLWIDDAFVVSLLHRLDRAGKWRTAIDAFMKIQRPTNNIIASHDETQTTRTNTSAMLMISIPTIKAVSDIVTKHSSSTSTKKQVDAKLESLWLEQRREK